MEVAAYSVVTTGALAFLSSYRSVFCWCIYLDLECLPVAVSLVVWCDGLLILTAPLWCACVCVHACECIYY